ncbi:MAG: glycosyltransferase [Deltaproteobacteria bacterium]|nr:glycosyltransferase [Deltaproteobacteria bacterium]MCZ6547510.1 glycosyltransferase [Deltaproteobacteria bacterium]MCZ6563115.1 glycosyltransferase [Deltaproteobacteria bacterium]
MDTDLVSVIIPTFDRRSMVGDAVESVLKQSHSRYELIVVDDGSQDGTVERLQRYGSRITVLSQPHRGVAAARNSGARWSGGRYLAFLDSDDLWHPNKLETQISVMNRNPSVQICQTEEIWVRNGVRVNPKKRHHKPSGDIFRASLDLCLVSPSAVMMTRELFMRLGGFDETFDVCEDYDLWLRIAVDTPVLLIPEPLVVKRGGHGDQLSRSTWGLDRFRILALEKLLRSGLGGEKRRWAMEVLAGKVAILAQGARKRGRESEALVYEQVFVGLGGGSLSTERDGVSC